MKRFALVASHISLVLALGCGTEPAPAPDDTVRFNRLYNRGLLFFHIEEYARAEEALRGAVQLRGSDPKPFYYLGRIYLMEKRFGKAEEMLREALRRDPSFTGADLLLAELFFQSRRLEEGREHIERLLLTRPGTPEVYYQLGWIRERQDRIPEALEAYRKVLEADPDHVEGWFHLGLVRMKSEAWAESEQAFAEALRRDPEHFGSLFNLAKVYGRLGLAEERREILARFQDLVKRTEEQIFRNSQVGYHSNLGITLFNSGKYEEAIPEFRKVLELNPKLSNGYFYLGSSHLALGQTARAMEILGKGADLAPDDERILTELGRAFALAGEFPRAIESFEEAIRRNRFFADPHFYLANILKAQNLTDRSRQQMAEFERLRSLAGADLAPEE
ncbi:MAG: tetratricopeptide repeat protein [Acidobacteria bacterium]|nr:tetratricopeptide repeat protein [Acidobacteriota bacterium]